MIPATLAQVLLGLLPVSAATTAAAPAAPAAATAPVTSVSASAVAPPHRSGLAVGVELGEPVSASVGWFADKLSVDGAIGTGTFAGPGLSVHVDGQLVVANLRPDVPVRVGIGARYYDQHYQPASLDELPQKRWGVRASAAIALEKPAWQVYAEFAPGVDFHRSASCNLADGANSVCPHAQSTPMFVQLVVGARWFFSH
jgi:hypothetical protein